MATTIDNFQLWQDLMALANVQHNGFIRPDINFTSWLNQVNVEMFQKYAAEFGLNQQLNDKLAPFVTSVNVPVVPTPGKPYDMLTMPANYEYFTNLRVYRQKDELKCHCNPEFPVVDGDGQCQPYVDPDIAAIKAIYASENIIERLVYDIDNQRWERSLEHPFKGPTWDAPFVTQIASQTGLRQMKIAPKGITFVVMDYLRTPGSAVFNYTYVDDQIVYDPTTSVNLEWSNVLKNEFLYRMLKKYGLYVGQPGIVQVAEEYLKGLE